jgi:hypothetical protein
MLLVILVIQVHNLVISTWLLSAVELKPPDTVPFWSYALPVQRSLVNFSPTGHCRARIVGLCVGLYKILHVVNHAVDILRAIFLLLGKCGEISTDSDALSLCWLI